MSAARAAVATVADPRFLGWSITGTITSLLAFGIVSAIVPNPVFGRTVPPTPFAIGVWLASAPLMGLIAATYLAPPPAATAPAASLGTAGMPPARADGTTAGTIGSLAAFLAIGCPLCNKVALLLLGASGTMTFFAPIQPLIGVVSLALLGGTVGWRLRLRARGGACAVAG